MRRSICHCEPSIAQAGDTNNWNFVFTTATTLPKGSCLKFDLLSEGREIDWEIPDVNLRKTRNLIFGMMKNGKIIQAKEVELPDRYAPQYEFVLPSSLSSGESFTIVIGAPKIKKGQPNGSRTQLNAQRRRAFNLYVDSSGKRRYGDPEVFYMDIKGSKLSNITVLTPSFVTKNKRFDIIVRFEDEFGNLTNNCPEDTLIELSYEQLRENLNWKLFVPETGFISLPNLYFNEPGVYTIELRNNKSKDIFYSSPIKCFSEGEDNLFWGLLHGESIRFDSTENIENCLRHFRDDSALNFFSASPFETQEETPNDLWKLISQNIDEFDENERFTTFLGFQWVGEEKDEGIRQVIYNKGGKPILRQKDAKNKSLKQLYKSLNPKEAIAIPSFTLGKGTEYNFKNFNPEFERVVEIYNAWGSSECTKNEKNPYPIYCPNKKGVQEGSEGSLLNALLNNKRFGFVAGGLDDRGVYSTFYEGDQNQYYPGLTAIIAKDHTRAALFDALYNRRCYGTTGAQIILGLFLAGSPMGTELNTGTKQGLLVNRHLSGYIAGTAPISSVEIIRNGEVIKTFSSDNYHLDFEYDDLIPLDKVTLKPKDQEPPFVFYYIRVTQEDGHIAWSSPIWVDHVPPLPIRVNPKKSSSKPLLIEEEEDEEDF